MKTPVAFLLAAGLLLSVSTRAADDDHLAVARAALRDGLWEVARTHAKLVGGTTGELLALESLAHEGKWGAVLGVATNSSAAAAADFAYYRALAEFRLGRADAARATLAGADFSGASCAGFAARLRAELDLASGETERAVAALKGCSADDVDARMLLASALLQSGDRAAAERIWQAVVVRTNACERAVATAAANLGDTNVLQRLVAAGRSPDVRQMAGLALGRKLAGDPATAESGARLVRSVVREAPDAPGAKMAFLFLAEAAFERSDFEAAFAVYSDALEMWPELAKSAAVQEGRAWALAGLGRNAEALEALRTAERLSTNDVATATIKVKAGDALSALGRLADAMAEYRDVLAKFPDTPAGARVSEVIRIRELEASGRADFKDYRFESAQRKFAEVAKADASRRARMGFYNVLCLYGEGRDEEAESQARALIGATVDGEVREEATLWLAKFTYNRGNWRDAEPLFVASADSSRATPERAAEALVWAARSAFAAGDSARAIQDATRLVTSYPDSSAVAKALVVQGEALIELARFDEAVLILERAALATSASADDRHRANVLRADALFAMGADNPTRYQEALDAYRSIRLAESLEPSLALLVSYKIARTLEKLKRLDEAVEQYYSQVVFAYRDGRAKGVAYSEDARAAFSRAAFRLAEECESRGQDAQAAQVLQLVIRSDVPAAEEAARRRNRLMKKGSFL